MGCGTEVAMGRDVGGTVGVGEGARVGVEMSTGVGILVGRELRDGEKVGVDMAGWDVASGTCWG